MIFLTVPFLLFFGFLIQRLLYYILFILFVNNRQFLYNERMKFKLSGEYQPSGDQPKAIKSLVKGLKDGMQMQTLLGATATGKTFTMAATGMMPHHGVASPPSAAVHHGEAAAVRAPGSLATFYGGVRWT